MKEADYSTYIRAFTRLFQVYDAATPYLDVPEDFKAYVEKKRSWLERLRSPEFPVAFLGAFSAGKSTIINAVLGDDILPQATKSLTAIPTLIRKGKTNKAVISYLTEAERTELRALYLEELSKELRTTPDSYRALGNRELLDRLKSEIERQIAQFGSFNKQKFFDELKALLEGWNKHLGEAKEIRLEELQNYVTEDYEDVLFVNQADVYLAEINLPENIVLVDLPGLGVVNPRHRKVTKTYVEHEAKAFVISMKVFHLLEGEEIELLAEIHSQRRRVLQRAFWVINQWDVLSAKQKKEEIQNFEQKIDHHGFQIARDRVFKVSALNYLLLKLIQEGRLDMSRGVRDHVDSLKKAIGRIPDRVEAGQQIKALEETKQFQGFRTGLFDYLAQTAKAEFLDEARAEYLDLVKRVRDWLEPLYRNYQEVDDAGLRSTFIAGQLSKRQDEALKSLRDAVAEHIMRLRTEILPEFIFWRDEDQAHLREQVTKAIDALDRKSLKNELLKGLDLNSVISRLPHKIEENLNVQKTFRTQLQKLLEEQIIQQHLADLLKAVTVTPALPEPIRSTLEDRLNGRDMVSRLKGMCDVFLFEYGEVINQFGRNVMEHESQLESEAMETLLRLINDKPEEALKVAKSLHLMAPKDAVGQLRSLGLDALSRIHGALTGTPPALPQSVNQGDAIDRALDHYKTGILDYAQRQQHQINLFARRGIKNYFEELEADLLSYFETVKSEIAQSIMRQLTEDLDAELSAEFEKQRIIRETYAFMTQEVGPELKRSEAA